ncbi:MAG: ARMT1-like domain-containing protein [bacterium]|jgi:uncharacterized protein with ATP-grasp and redox domains|nr:ARMT1-like domain-containing protein [bacterium]
MKSYLECVPCFIRQTWDVLQRVTGDQGIQEGVMRNVLWAVSRMDLNDPPPVMSQYIHQMIRRKTGLIDPYKEIKELSNRVVLSMYDRLKEQIQESADPLETALRLAIAGNLIDMGARSHIDAAYIQDAINRAFVEPLAWNREAFVTEVEQAGAILYLADNAGEIVFDRLLIEELPMEKITVAVRGYPILNDATMDDAREVGLTEIVRVMDTGAAAPGIVLSDSSESFVQAFEEADLILSKGQGNYETLSDCEKDIFFILTVKCPVIARDLDCRPGEMIVRKNQHSLASTQ